jgi:TonB family protein
MSDSWKDCEGQVIDGQFTLLQHLGGSDHSVVFSTQRGKDKSEKAAIKFIQADAASAETQLARWKQAAQISHPNLIKLFENGRCQLAGMDLLYVVMEYAQENLAQFLPERALSPAETRDMLEPFIETLTGLHGKGFVHGRIKPGNILAIDDQLKLSSDSLCREGETQIGAGKIDAYVAPESASGKSSSAGDVWSLGVTLVETLTQHVPEGKDQEPQVSDSVPQPFLDIARHGLRRDAQSRWTVAEISARLNPPATPPAPNVPAPAIPDPIKPTAIKTPAGASTSAVPAAKPAANVGPPTSVDPLSVPLSPVSPLPSAKRHSLEDQTAGGGISPNRSYYVVVGVLVALTLGAMLAIPRLRDRQPEADTSAAPSHPSVQPESMTPTKNEPPAAAKPQPKVLEKQSTPAPVRPAQRSDLQAPQGSQKSLTPASERDPIKKELSASNSAPVSVAPARPASPVPVGAVTRGEVLNQVLPEVSAKSRSTIRGTVRVVVKVHVDASGAVTRAEPASSPSRFFGDAAVQAAKQWDFAPAKVAEQAVPSEWLVRFDFTQNDTKVLPSQTNP